MSRRALTLLTCLACLTAVTAAGCGGGDTDAKNDYVQSVERARTAFSTRFGQIQAQFTTTSTAAQDRRSLQQFAQATTSVIKSLEQIDPPEQVTEQHGELVAAYEKYLAAINAARKTARGGSAADLQEARTGLSTAIQPVQTAVMTAVADINDELRS